MRFTLLAEKQNINIISLASYIAPLFCCSFTLHSSTWYHLHFQKNFTYSYVNVERVEIILEVATTYTLTTQATGMDHVYVVLTMSRQALGKDEVSKMLASSNSINLRSLVWYKSPADRTIHYLVPRWGRIYKTSGCVF